MRFRPGVVLGAALACLALTAAGQAQAAAEVHRLNLVLSGIPTSIAGGDFNDAIGRYNEQQLDPLGYDRLKELSFTWMFDAELRYFVRPNFAVTAGVSHLRAKEQKEFLPALSEGVNITTEILTVPVHVGAAYYLQPYNQGDFRAQAYFGGGMIHYSHTRATFEQTLSMVNYDSSFVATWGGDYRYTLTQDAPAYYGEFGAHMFFASRFSALISVEYRTGVLRGMRIYQFDVNGQPIPIPPYTPIYNPDGSEFTVDVGGVGVRLGVGIGF